MAGAGRANLPFELISEAATMSKRAVGWLDCRKSDTSASLALLDLLPFRCARSILSLLATAHPSVKCRRVKAFDRFQRCQTTSRNRCDQRYAHRQPTRNGLLVSRRQGGTHLV